MVDWGPIEAECQVAGLLELLRTTIVDDDLVIEKLEAASAFCIAEGAYSVAELPEFELADDFIAALEPLRRVPRKKLQNALSGKEAERADSRPRREEHLRHAESELKSPGDVIALRGRKYTLSALLNHGNAEIWLCTNEEGASRVLKITDADSVLEEVEARKAIGWDQHTRTVLQAFEYEGQCIVLEKAERTRFKPTPGGSHVGSHRIGRWRILQRPAPSQPAPCSRPGEQDGSPRH